MRKVSTFTFKWKLIHIKHQNVAINYLIIWIQTDLLNGKCCFMCLSLRVEFTKACFHLKSKKKKKNNCEINQLNHTV